MNRPLTQPTLGFLSNGFWHLMAVDLWHGVVTAAEAQNANLISYLGNMLIRPEDSRDATRGPYNVLYQLIDSRRLDGLIIWHEALCTYRNASEMAAFYAQLPALPTIAIGNAPTLPHVLLDFESGMARIITHLIEDHGYLRIAYVGGPSNNPSALSRYKGYVAALAANDVSLDPSLLLPEELADWGQQWPRRQGPWLRDLMARTQGDPKQRIHAIACVSDDIANRVISDLQGMGYYVPDDIAVVGFDDYGHRGFALSSVALTTAPLGLKPLGQRAVDLMIAHLRDGAPLPAETYITTPVLIRRSCGCFPGLRRSQAPIEETPTLARVTPDQRGLEAELQAALYVSPDTLPADWAAQLLAAAVASLAYDADIVHAPLLSVLDRLLQAFIRGSDEVEAWLAVLNLLRNQLSAYAVTPQQQMFIETLGHYAQTLLNATAQQIHMRELYRVEQWAVGVQNDGMELIVSRSLSELSTLLSERATRRRIPNCYMALYADPQQPTGEAILHLAYDNQQFATLPPDGLRFSASLLIPDVYLPMQRPYNLVLQSLHDEDGYLGFLLLGNSAQGQNPIERDMLARTCEILRNGLVRGLHNIRILTQQKEAEIALGARAQELEAANARAEEARLAMERANAALEQRAQELGYAKDNAELEQQQAEEARRASEEARRVAEEAREAAEQAQRRLHNANSALEAQMWHTRGIALLNEKLRGEQDVHQLADNVMQHLCQYLNIHTGILYVREEEQLTLAGGYAYARSRAVPQMPVGDYLLGQAIYARQPITLTDVPPNYATVVSGLGQATPQTLLIQPLVYEGEAIGVLELGMLMLPTESQMNFLNTALESIAIAFNTARARARINTLLIQTRRQAEELQHQSEELRVANEELEAQTQSLRTSEARLRAQQEQLATANKELEEKQAELDRHNRALEVAQKELERRAAELAQASQYKSEFLANMSHELRTPLNSLLILSRMLAENEAGNLLEDQVESAKIIHRSGSDLLDLINEILDLSKVEAGKMEFHFAPMYLTDLVNLVQTHFAHVAAEKGLEFTATCDADLPDIITSDMKRVAQIVKNLLSNAFKFTHTGSVALHIGRPDKDAVGALSDGAMIAFSVRDTGIGMTPEQQQRLFQAFQQADGSTSRKYGGTGLGLSISRELARRLGGEIEAQSTYGVGSTFTLYLPETSVAALDVDEAAAEMDSPAGGEAQPATSNQRRATANTKPTSRRRKSSAAHATLSSATASTPFPMDDRDTLQSGDRVLLIVEDDANFAKVVRDYAHRKEFKCLLAGDGKIGLALAREKRPDAIILDLNLPQLNGWAVLDRLKEDPATRHIPVHIMSVEDETLDAYRHGAIGFLSKPVSPEALEASFTKMEHFIARHIKTLLLVEDDTHLRASVKKLLAGEDVEIHEVGTGGAALTMLRERGLAEPLDCMILDLNLPDMSGFDLLTHLGADTQIARCPIIVYTGRELSQEETEMLRQHADSIVVKGVKSPERLLDETALFLHRVVADLPSEKQSALRQPRSPELTLKGKRLLLVDDDVRNTFALSKVLNEKGLCIQIAPNGKRALEILSEQTGIDLILMDIMMPDMDGYETIRQIRAQKRLPSLPIIALTAKAMVGDQEKCLEAGANDYLSKPIDLDKLFSLLRVWLAS
ncbi:MAG TPA: response regulator [Anaerolineae bacterium]|nr:response regulator [Anaerolineae bacterium]